MEILYEFPPFLEKNYILSGGSAEEGEGVIRPNDPSVLTFWIVTEGVASEQRSELQYLDVKWAPGLDTVSSLTTITSFWSVLV